MYFRSTRLKYLAIVTVFVILLASNEAAQPLDAVRNSCEEYSFVFFADL